MVIRAGGDVFGLGNRVGTAGGLDLQEIRVAGGGQKSSHPSGGRWLIYSTLHLKYICFFWQSSSS